jgi:hypothetical protein
VTKTALLLRLGVSLAAVMTPVAAVVFGAAGIAGENDHRSVLIGGAIALVLSVVWWSLVVVAWGDRLWRWTSS